MVIPRSKAVNLFSKVLMYTVKKVSDSPVPSLDVNNQTPLAGMSLTKLSLIPDETGKSKTFLTVWGGDTSRDYFFAFFEKTLFRTVPRIKNVLR
jgi:hypothetical protein